MGKYKSQADKIRQETDLLGDPERYTSVNPYAIHDSGKPTAITGSLLAMSSSLKFTGADIGDGWFGMISTVEQDPDGWGYVYADARSDRAYTTLKAIFADVQALTSRSQFAPKVVIKADESGLTYYVTGDLLPNSRNYLATADQPSNLEKLIGGSDTDDPFWQSNKKINFVNLVGYIDHNPSQAGGFAAMAKPPLLGMIPVTRASP